MSKNFWKVSCLIFIASCSVGPDFEPPQTEVSKEWQGNKSSTDKLVNKGGEIDLKWWNSFNDPLLVELIEQAAIENLDIKKALLHIKESRNIKDLVISDLFPAVNITANYKRDRQSENNDFSFDSSYSGRDFYETGFDATWELDIFGKIRRDVEASKAELEGSADAARNIYLMTFAEVAKNYLELRTLQKEKNIIQGNIDLQLKSFELIEKKFNLGVGSKLDVLRQQALLDSTKSRLPQIDSGISVRIHALSVLLGKEPNQLAEKLEQRKEIPELPQVVKLGIPSEILRRRPDIRQAEREIEAANARVGVAIGDLYPKFTLVGDYSLSARNLNDVFNGSSGNWSVGPKMVWQIVSANTIFKNIQIKEAVHEQTVVAYQKTILSALQEVEDNLVKLENERLRQQSLNNSYISNLDSVELAKKMYDEGNIDFLDLIQTQTSLLEAQDNLVKSEGDIVLNLLALYKSLGGGWEVFNNQIMPNKEG